MHLSCRARRISFCRARPQKRPDFVVLTFVVCTFAVKNVLARVPAPRFGPGSVRRRLLTPLGGATGQNKSKYGHSCHGCNFQTVAARALKLWEVVLLGEIYNSTKFQRPSGAFSGDMACTR